MFKITEGPIHYMEKRCVVPAKKRMNRDMLERYDNVYANNEHYNERFNDLGVPMFIMNTKTVPLEDEMMVQSHEGMISDEMFDELFERAIKKPNKKKSPKTLKKRGKKEKDKKEKDKKEKDKK